jgi:hypothetical protein
VIAAVSPANGSYSETVNTLRYAQRAKHIINKPRMSAHPDDSSKTIQELRAEVAKLKTALAKIQMVSSLHARSPKITLFYDTA